MYNGIRVNTRNPESKYIVHAHDRWYYFDWGGRLNGPYDSREEAIAALRKAWEDHDLNA